MCVYSIYLYTYRYKIDRDIDTGDSTQLPGRPLRAGVWPPQPRALLMP